jgi:hypothetical protein
MATSIPSSSFVPRCCGRKPWRIEPYSTAPPVPVFRKEPRKNMTETPLVVSAAADSVSQDSVGEDQLDHLETLSLEPAAQLPPHSESASRPAEPVDLQVSAEQLDEWRSDVAEQHQMVALAQVAYARACASSWTSARQEVLAGANCGARSGISSTSWRPSSGSWRSLNASSP